MQRSDRVPRQAHRYARLARPTIPLLLLLSAAPALADDVGAQAAALEARLLAPCCYKQTLDFHASPLAEELRAEIRRRFSTGESEATIEAALVARYGEKLRAVPSAAFTERLGMGLALLSAAVVALIVLLHLARLRRTRPPASVSASESGDPADRLRLEEELRALD